jgi:methionine-rich copper-binding protein CopC
MAASRACPRILDTPRTRPRLAACAHRRGTAISRQLRTLISLLGLVLSLSVPQLASAHAELVSSTPAANASLPESPGELSMTFTEPIDPATASVQLLDESQTAVKGVGEVQAPGNATTAQVALPKLDPGVYTVSYRVTSATDGHVTAGIFAFQIDPTGTQPAPTNTATSTSPSSDPATVAARWVALVAALVLFGTALFWLVSGRPAMRSAGTGDLGGRAVWAALAGIGLASGYATIGVIGFENRKDYAAIGPVTNLAARLCSEAQDGHILIPEHMVHLLGNMAQSERIGELVLKGFHQPVIAYNVTGLTSSPG